MGTQWFEQRAGHVTASTLYDVCHTSIDTPSCSLTRHICYPHENKVITPQSIRGKKKQMALQSTSTWPKNWIATWDFTKHGFSSLKNLFFGGNSGSPGEAKLLQWGHSWSEMPVDCEEWAVVWSLARQEKLRFIALRFPLLKKKNPDTTSRSRCNYLYERGGIVILSCGTAMRYMFKR